MSIMRFAPWIVAGLLSFDFLSPVLAVLSRLADLVSLLLFYVVYPFALLGAGLDQATKIWAQNTLATEKDVTPRQTETQSYSAGSITLEQKPIAPHRITVVVDEAARLTGQCNGRRRARQAHRRSRFTPATPGNGAAWRDQALFAPRLCSNRRAGRRFAVSRAID